MSTLESLYMFLYHKSYKKKDNRIHILRIKVSICGTVVPLNNCIPINETFIQTTLHDHILTIKVICILMKRQSEEFLGVF